MSGTQKELNKSTQSNKNNVIEVNREIQNNAVPDSVPSAPQQQEHAPNENIIAINPVKEKIRLRLDMMKNTHATKYYFPDQTELLKGYGKTFNDTMVNYQRMRLRFTEPKSELFKRSKNEERLRRGIKNFAKTRNENMLSVMKDKKVGCDKQTWEDLSFFINTEDQKASDAFIDSYLGTVSEKGVYQEGDVTDALKTATFRILELDLSELNMETDEKIADNVSRLEQITGMVSAYDRLMEKHPEFLASLEEDEQTRISEHCDLLRTIAAYYIARWDLMENKYYQEHLPEEMSPDTDAESTEEQVKVAKKLVRAYILGNALREKVGMEVTDPPEDLLESDSAQEMLDKKNEVSSDATKRQMIAEYTTERQSFANEYMEKTSYHINRLTMVFDVDNFLELLRNDPELKGVRITEEGIQVARNIEALHAFLTNQMPPIKRNAKGIIDKAAEADAMQEIESSTIVIAMLFNRLIESITAVETANADSAEILRMFSQLKASCEKDSELFKGKAIEYRDFMIADPTFGKKRATWNDALRHTRSEFYDLDSKNVSVKMDGAGASQVYAITPKNATAGSKTVYFRKEDRVPSADSREMIKDILGFYEIPEEESKRISQTLALMSHDENGFEAILENISAMKKAKSSPETVGKFLITSVKGLQPLGRTANKAKYTTYGHIIMDVADSWFKRNIAQRIAQPAKIAYGSELSKRNVATSRMAAILGISHLICDSRTAVIKQNNKRVQGNIMEATGGVEMKRNMNAVYSHEAISDLFTLSIFDLVCGQTDRHFGNFHALMDQGIITGIKGLDNDMAFGELEFADIKDGYNRIRRISEEGLIGLPTTFINSLMALTPQYLKQVLGDLLSTAELACLWDRIQGVTGSIITLAKSKSNMKWHADKKKIEFTGEDKDDKLRQLKTLQGIAQNVRSVAELEEDTMFRYSVLSKMNLGSEILQRRYQLNEEQYGIH